MIFLCLLTLLSLTMTSLSAPVITAPWGTIQGVDWTTPNGSLYSAYLGIPFAQPPVGPLRFQKPQPHPGPGNGTVFNATAFGPACLQPSGFSTQEVMGSEDCLTLNVFTPASNISAIKNVMVWIHGGGYTNGLAIMYDPHRLVLDNDLIVVIIQYRLGPLGFLSTGDSFLPGNWGLWDQWLALKWIKDNIAAFGGDSDSITIMGESAGSGSVTLHLLSPQSSGLFTRVIAQSGSASALWSNNLYPAQSAFLLAQRLGCYDNKTDYLSQRQTLLTCLRDKDPRNITATGVLDSIFEWIPCVDGDFMPEPPSQLLTNVTYLQSVNFFSRDLMMGINNNEGGLLVTLTPDVSQLQQLPFVSRLTSQFLSQLYGSYNPDILKVIAYKYFVPVNRISPNILKRQGVLNAAMDTLFLGSIVEYTRAHAQSNIGTGKTYLYLFDYYPVGAPLGGMSHGQDTIFLFSREMNYPQPGAKLTLDARDEEVAATFASFLATFAATGDPSPAVSTFWPQFTATNESYLSFSDDVTVQENLYPDRVSFYLDLMPALQRGWTEGQTTPSPSEEPGRTSGRLERFDLDIKQADDAIAGLIAATVVLFVIAVVALSVACCMCCRSKRSTYGVGKPV